MIGRRCPLAEVSHKTARRAKKIRAKILCACWIGGVRPSFGVVEFRGRRLLLSCSLQQPGLQLLLQLRMPVLHARRDVIRLQTSRGHWSRQSGPPSSH